MANSLYTWLWAAVLFGGGVWVAVTLDDWLRKARSAKHDLEILRQRMLDDYRREQQSRVGCIVCRNEFVCRSCMREIEAEFPPD